MTAKNKLEALKAAFEKKDNSATQHWNLFYKFWSIPTDSTAIVRFLPDLDEDNSLGFLVENLTHDLTINGKRQTLACGKMYGHDCPICNLSRKYYDEKDEVNGKKYYRKKSYIGQVIVVESPIEHDQAQTIKLIEFGPAVFKAIQAGFQSGDLEAPPYELKGGYNFRIRKTKSGEYASYSTSSFATKQTDCPVPEDELKLFNLTDYRRAEATPEKLQAFLDAEQTGASVPDAEPSKDVEPPVKAEEPKVEKAEVKQSASEKIKAQLAARGKK